MSFRRETTWRRGGAAFALGVGLALAWAPRSAAANDRLGNPTLEVSIHLKVLAYDRALTSRSKGKLRVAILYKEGNAESQRTMSDMLALLNYKGLAAQGRSIEARAVKYSEKTLAVEAEGLDAGAIYICPGLEDAIGSIVRLATEKKLVTLGGGLGPVKQGVAVGVYLRSNGRPGVAINLTTAKAAGMLLEPSVLSLAAIFE